MDRITLGTFEVTSGTLVLSDPGYKRGIRGNGDLQNVKIGTWTATMETAKVKFGGTEVTRLIAQYAFTERPRHDICWIPTSFEIGIDSGQAGIYDEAVFASQDRSWYQKCSEITLSQRRAGVLEGGVVSLAEEGGHDAFYAINHREEIVAVQIIFVDDAYVEDNSEADKDAVENVTYSARHFLCGQDETEKE